MPGSDLEGTTVFLSRKLHILVVDDDPVIVEGLVALLRHEAFEPEGVFDRESAEEAMAAEHFPIVLADLRLRSEEEGWRLLDSIARISPGTPSMLSPRKASGSRKSSLTRR